MKRFKPKRKSNFRPNVFLGFIAWAEDTNAFVPICLIISLLGAFTLYSAPLVLLRIPVAIVCLYLISKFCDPNYVQEVYNKVHGLLFGLSLFVYGIFFSAYHINQPNTFISDIFLEEIAFVLPFIIDLIASVCILNVLMGSLYLTIKMILGKCLNFPLKEGLIFMIASTIRGKKAKTKEKTEKTVKEIITPEENYSSVKAFFHLPPITNEKELYKKFSEFELNNKLVKAVHCTYAFYFEIEDKIRDIFEEVGEEYDEYYDHFPLPFDIPITLKFDRFITTDDPFIIEFWDGSTLAIFVDQDGVIAEMNALKPDNLSYYTFNASFLFRGIINKKIVDIKLDNGKFDIFYRTPGYSEFHDYLQFSMDMFEYMNIAQMHRTPTQNYVATLRAPYWEYVFPYEEEYDDVSVCDITEAAITSPKAVKKAKAKIIPAAVSISSKALIAINLSLWVVWGLTFLLGSDWLIGLSGFVFGCVGYNSINKLFPAYSYDYAALGFLPFAVWIFCLPIIHFNSDIGLGVGWLVALNLIAIYYLITQSITITKGIIKYIKKKKQ
ncbi:MAG: hypothetical protein IKV58_00275 [Oscillospiraceae bacterium]|nr:hypothetical protein [Oscillospiraceae bacterium]